MLGGGTTVTEIAVNERAIWSRHSASTTVRR